MAHVTGAQARLVHQMRTRPFGERPASRSPAARYRLASMSTQSGRHEGYRAPLCSCRCVAHHERASAGHSEGRHHPSDRCTGQRGRVACTGAGDGYLSRQNGSQGAAGQSRCQSWLDIGTPVSSLPMMTSRKGRSRQLCPRTPSSYQEVSYSPIGVSTVPLVVAGHQVTSIRNPMTLHHLRRRGPPPRRKEWSPCRRSAQVVAVTRAGRTDGRDLAGSGCRNTGARKDGPSNGCRCHLRLQSWSVSSASDRQKFTTPSF